MKDFIKDNPAELFIIILSILSAIGYFTGLSRANNFISGLIWINVAIWVMAFISAKTRAKILSHRFEMQDELIDMQHKLIEKQQSLLKEANTLLTAIKKVASK